jgi:hypothetical protein
VALPTASTPGYTSYTDANGTTWVACTCLAEWLPWFERVLKARGLVKNSIDIWQLTGGAKASGNTHSQGGAFDLLYQTTPGHVAVAREMGAPATWGRKKAQGFTQDHTHGVLSGCPHNGPAAYQITAQKRGYNGLGQGYYNGEFLWGYGHADEFPNPITYRTWQEGIAWAKAELARLAPPEDIMASLDDLKAVIAEAKLLTKDDGQTIRNDLAWQNKQAAGLAGQIAGLSLALKSLADGQGVDLAAVTAAAQAGAQAALDAKISGATTTLAVQP